MAEFKINPLWPTTPNQC